VCRNLAQFGDRATPASGLGLERRRADTCSRTPSTASSGNGTRPEPAMLRNPRLASTLFAVLCSLCVLANSSVGARPAKNTSSIAPPAKQAPIRTDLTPRNKNDCLAVAQTLNERAKKLSRQTKRAVPPEFTSVGSDLGRSCGQGDYNKAWISMEWMNGCLDNFTKDAELGFCSRNEGYACALGSRSDSCVPRR
jgi:hypothetical protein